MILNAIYCLFLAGTVSSFLLDDTSTTATSVILSNKELTDMLLDERALRHSMTQRILSLETAVTTLYHTVEKLSPTTHSQTTSTDTENKILKLENRFNSSISNISTAVDNLIHTQLNVNNMMAYFDRNMNNISLTVNNILHHQNNISTQQQLTVLQHAYNNIQDGSWSVWGSWGSCSATCSGGMRSRHRSCNNPAPSMFGKSCIGNSIESEICNNKKCPSPMVYFTVHSPNGTLTTTGRPLFRTVVSNHGGGYNMETAVFTAPVRGLYHFAFTFVQESTTYIDCFLYHNSNILTRAWTGSNNQWTSASVAVFVYLDIGDTVDLRYCENWQFVWHDSGSIFTGALVMPS